MKAPLILATASLAVILAGFLYADYVSRMARKRTWARVPRFPWRSRIAATVAALTVFTTLVLLGRLLPSFSIPPLRWLGAVLALSGAVLCAGSTLALGEYFTPWDHAVEGQKTVTRGPYRLIRHPLYLGYVLSALGVPLSAGWTGALPLSPCLAIALWHRAKREENSLAEVDPSYFALVPSGRWLPRLKKSPVRDVRSGKEES